MEVELLRRLRLFESFCTSLGCVSEGDADVAVPRCVSPAACVLTRVSAAVLRVLDNNKAARELLSSSAPRLLGSSALFSLILSLRRRGCWDLSAHPDNFGLIRRRRSDFQRFVGRSGRGGDERNISRLHVWIRGEGLEGPSASTCACGGILRPEGVWWRPGGSAGGSRGGFSKKFSRRF